MAAVARRKSHLVTSIREQRRYRDRLLARIRARAQSGRSSIGAPLHSREVSRYLSSHAVQSVALLDVWRRENHEDPTQLWREWQHPRLPYQIERARYRPVYWYPKKRRTSGFRKICKLPIQLKVWHVLAKDLIYAQHQVGPHIAGWPGNDRHMQIREIADAIIDREQWVVIADVRRAFPTFKPSAIYELHSLPEDLVRRAIDSRYLNFTGGMRSNPTWVKDTPMCDDLEMDPTGLLEGSPASNAIFSVFLNDLPDHMPGGVNPFVYCDNIVLVCPSEACAQQAESSLVRYFSDHRAGPFEVTSECKPVWHGFDHLGYSISHNLGVTRVGLSASSWEKLHCRIRHQQQYEVTPEEWLRASFSALHGYELAPYEMMIADGPSQQFPKHP